MKLGDYVDGRVLNYDERQHLFDIGGTTVTADQVYAYDLAGQVTWVSDATRTWFAEARATVVPAPALSQSSPEGKTPWFKKWWVWGLAVLILLAAAATGGEPGASDSDSKTGAVSPSSATTSESAAASEPVVKTLDLAVTAPGQVESQNTEIKGKTLPGASVTINGQSVTVDASGGFVLGVKLVDGGNAFEVAASLDGYEDASKIVNVNRRTFKALTARDFELIVKDPDAHAGETYIIYGEVTQFDSATGTDVFRANTGSVKKKIEYGFTDYDVNSMLTGDEKTLANIVNGDCFQAKVIVTGSFSYDTQIGGNTTVPSFEIVSISPYGSTAS